VEIKDLREPWMEHVDPLLEDEVYRPRLLRHQVELYAARAAG
jgi:hypothetical protein